MNIILLYGVIISLLSIDSHASAEERLPIVMYVYQNNTPFIKNLETKSGLSFDLAKYLNHKQKKYIIAVKYLPRKRLHFYLNNKPVIMILTNKSWQNDKNGTKYLWSGPVLLEKKYFIWSIEKPIDFKGFESLRGLTFGAVRGYNYSQLEPYFIDKSIQKEIGDNEVSNLKKLLAGRIDFTEISLSSYRTYLIENKDMVGKFVIHKKANYETSRDIMFTKDYLSFFQFINPIILNMKHDKEWHQYLEKYFEEYYTEFINIQ